jgi:hypothetical protein
MAVEPGTEGLTLSVLPGLGEIITTRSNWDDIVDYRYSVFYKRRRWIRAMAEVMLQSSPQLVILPLASTPLLG